MIRRRFVLIVPMVLLVLFFLISTHGWRASAATKAIQRRSPVEIAAPYVKSPQLTPGQRPTTDGAPAPAIEPFVRPEFARQMHALRPIILEAARRHNRPEYSHMSDRDFAVVIAVLLYNENFGSLEEQVRPLRALTPFYQDLQTRANEVGGGNFSVWPANLRPSVALEILRHQVPVPTATGVITEPVRVEGSRIDIDAYPSQNALYAALTEEISQPRMAVEYLAANLERGLYRAHFEHVSVTWRALAAWHNQGIVSPEDIRANPTAHDYVRRTSAYLAIARALIDTAPCQYLRCQLTE